ncbi:MAG TPA: hypothetical protein VHF92_02520 [Geodermatophilus sp.]|nr:hypothetical protein [Geodermatophilus sp.]
MELPKKLLVTSALTGAFLMPAAAAQAVVPAPAAVGAAGTVIRTAPDTVPLSPRDYHQGYRDGYRDGAADARQSAMAFCAGTASVEGHPGHGNPNVDYANGYEDGWNDAWPRAFHRNVHQLCPDKASEEPAAVS